MNGYGVHAFPLRRADNGASTGDRHLKETDRSPGAVKNPNAPIPEDTGGNDLPSSALDGNALQVLAGLGIAKGKP